MSSLKPIHYKKFEKFLKYIECTFVRTTGDHRIWKRADLSRPIVIPIEKDLPVFIISNILRLLKMNREEYFDIINEL